MTEAHYEMPKGYATEKNSSGWYRWARGASVGIWMPSQQDIRQSAWDHAMETDWKAMRDQEPEKPTDQAAYHLGRAWTFLDEGKRHIQAGRAEEAKSATSQAHAAIGCAIDMAAAEGDGA